MKLLDTVSKVSLIALVVLILFGVSELREINHKAKSFYEINSKKINLKLVKNMEARLEYIITFKEDESADIFRKYSTKLNPNEIENVQRFLLLAQKSDFYNVEVVAFLKLDSESAELFHSQRYLKKAKNYSVNKSMLESLSRYGLDDFQYKNLEKLKDKVYEDRDTFLDEVVSYARLKRGEWSEKNIPLLGLGDKGIKFMRSVGVDAKEKSLEEEDIESLVENLKVAYEKYRGIE